MLHILKPDIRRLYLVFCVIFFLFITASSSSAYALHFRHNQIELDNSLDLQITQSMKFEEFDALHVRNEIDSIAGSGNGNGFIEEHEVEAYESQLAEEALNIARHISMDDTSAYVKEYNVEIIPIVIHSNFSFMGKNLHSFFPKEKNYYTIRCLAPVKPNSNESPHEIAAKVRHLMIKEISAIENNKS